MKATRLHKVFASKSLLFSLVALFLYVPTFVNAEEVALFSADIVVEKDGSFVVTEQIQYDFGREERHGIFRDIHYRHPQEATAWYTKRAIEIQVDSVMRAGQNEPYKLEDDSKQLRLRIGDPDATISGVQTYTITYRVFGGLSYLDNGEVELYWNATGHNWPVVIKRAEVVMRDPYGVLLAQKACYEGGIGSTAPCVTDMDPERRTIFLASNLAPGFGLTIAQAVNPDAVEVVVIEHIRWMLFFLPGAVLFVFVSVIYWLRFRFANKPQAPVIVQYEPYEGVLPMYTGLLYDNRLDGRDITASILYLAQQGFLKIKKVDKKVLFFVEVDDYEVTLIRDPRVGTTQFQREILMLLFPEYNINTPVRLSNLKNEQRRQRQNYRLLQKLKKTLKKDMVEKGFLEQKFGFTRRTQKGYDALWHIKGFKDFLQVTDAERFKFHNAPSKSPEQFMQYLPYAVAFGVEKEWAEVFKDMTIEPPDWYDGGDVGTFSAVSAANSLNAFSTAVNAASGSGYSSSSSASGGGGFSGGGGGGGGGGSW